MVWGLPPARRRRIGPDACERQTQTLGDVTRGLLIAYRDELRAKGYAVATIARKFSCVRQALEYAFAEGLIPCNPAKTVKTYKVLDISPRYALDAVLVRALLAQPKRDTLKGARDYAILMLLLYLGARRSEVAGLTCGQFGEERSHATVRLYVDTPPATARGILGSTPQPTPRLPEGPARPIECSWPRSHRGP